MSGQVQELMTRYYNNDREYLKTLSEDIWLNDGVSRLKPAAKICIKRLNKNM